MVSRACLLMIYLTCSLSVNCFAGTLHVSNSVVTATNGNSVRVPATRSVKKSLPAGEDMNNNRSSSWWNQTAIFLGGMFGRKKEKKATVAISVDAELVGKIKVGWQTFKVIIDLGSGNLWVYGKDVNTDYFFADGEGEIGSSHTFYDPSDSDTFQQDDEFEGSKNCYDDGCEVLGKAGREEVSLGRDMTLHNTQFGIVNKIEGTRGLFTAYDGILGLSLSRTSIDRSRSVLTHLSESGLLHRNMVSIYLGPFGGSILLGGSDERYYNKKSVHTAQVLDGEKWSIGVEMASFGDEMGFKKKKSDSLESLIIATVDTGTRSIILPEDLIESFSKKHTLESGYIPCEKRASLPTLNLRIGGKDYSLTGDDYTSLRHDTKKGGNKEKLCLVALGKSDDDGEMTLGGPFLRKYYTMFHFPPPSSPSSSKGTKKKPTRRMLKSGRHRVDKNVPYISLAPAIHPKPGDKYDMKRRKQRNKKKNDDDDW